MDDVNQARTDATIEIGNRFIEVISESLARHGKDPYNLSIIVAAYAYSVDFINAIDPEFRSLLVGVISNKDLNEKVDVAFRAQYMRSLRDNDQNS
jgi:hypothetical protein